MVVKIYAKKLVWPLCSIKRHRRPCLSMDKKKPTSVICRIPQGAFILSLVPISHVMSEEKSFEKLLMMTIMTDTHMAFCGSCLFIMSFWLSFIFILQVHLDYVCYQDHIPASPMDIQFSIILEILQVCLLCLFSVSQLNCDFLGTISMVMGQRLCPLWHCCSSTKSFWPNEALTFVSLVYYETVKAIGP